MKKLLTNTLIALCLAAALPMDLYAQAAGESTTGGSTTTGTTGGSTTGGGAMSSQAQPTEDDGPDMGWIGLLGLLGLAGLMRKNHDRTTTTTAAHR